MTRASTSPVLLSARCSRASPQRALRRARSPRTLRAARRSNMALRRLRSRLERSRSSRRCAAGDQHHSPRRGGRGALLRSAQPSRTGKAGRDSSPRPLSTLDGPAALLGEPRASGDRARWHAAEQPSRLAARARRRDLVARAAPRAVERPRPPLVLFVVHHELAERTAEEVSSARLPASANSALVRRRRAAARTRPLARPQSCGDEQCEVRRRARFAGGLAGGASDCGSSARGSA